MSSSRCESYSAPPLELPAGRDAGIVRTVATPREAGAPVVAVVAPGRRCCWSRCCATELREGAAEIVVPLRPFATGRFSTCTVRESRFAFSDAYVSCSRLRACSRRCASAAIRPAPPQHVSTPSVHCLLKFASHLWCLQLATDRDSQVGCCCVQYSKRSMTTPAAAAGRPPAPSTCA